MKNPARSNAGALPLVLLIIASLTAGCSGSNSQVSQNLGTTPKVAATATASPIASPFATAPPAAPDAGVIDCSDCWPTYAHDYQRTSFQKNDSGINLANVANLAEKWAWPLHEQVVASPVIDNGMLYVVTGAGNVYDFNSSNGTILWSRNLGGPILETPTIDHGSLYVGTHHAPSVFYSLNATSGAIQWQATISGVFRGPAAVSNGIVYVGEAGGDPPVCDPGGVHGYQTTTGTQTFFWRTDLKPLDGGAVWTPISIDGANVLFGTGNTCSTNVFNGNSLIRLTASGAEEWENPITQPTTEDDDWGGATLVSRGRYYAANKNGSFVAINPSTGGTIWSRPLSTVDGQGSIGSPSTDGLVIIVPSGDLLDGNFNSPPTANFTAYTNGGSTIWTYPLDYPQRNYAPISNGIAYLAGDSSIVAVNYRTGAKVWSYNSSGAVEFISAPAITSDGLFTVDTDGAVILFAPATSPSAAAASTIHLKQGPLYEPYGSIMRSSRMGSPVKY